MTDNPYAAPQTAPQPEVPTYERAPAQLASRWARLGASILDGLIIFLLFIPLLFVAFAAGLMPGVENLADFMENIGSAEQSMIANIVSTLIGVVIYLAINGYLLISSGQSLGKKILGIQIVDRNSGQLLPASRVIGLRYLLVTLITQIPLIGGVFGLVDVLFIFRADKRCIHDLIANSCVIKN